MASESPPPLGSRVLVVAPHLDDAVLSASAILHSRAADAVLTVFAGLPDPAVVTEWDIRCGYPDSTAAVTARRQEDDLAFEGLGVRRTWLDLLDSPYRPGLPTEEDAAVLCAAIAEWRDGDGGLIAVPAGAGRALRLVERARLRLPIPGIGLPGGAPPHPDHLWVTDLVLTAFPSAAVLLYEEIPYAWVRRADRRVAELARTFGREVWGPLSFPVNVADKARRVSAYQSQLDGILGPSAPDLDKVLDDRERMWILRPARRPTPEVAS